jgi:hypothetical protein
MADPNGKPIQIAHEVNAVLPIGTTTGTMMVGLGVPGGQIVLLATTVIGALLSVLFGWQKKIANGQTSAVTATTKAIVDAIEEVSAVKTADGTTVGAIVKAKVQSNMQANNIYEVGKQIVTALKTAE